jgi:PAS fold
MNKLQVHLNIEGNVVDANAVALACIRANAQDVIGKPFWEAPWFAATESVSEFIFGIYGDLVTNPKREGRVELALRLPSQDRLFLFAMRPIYDRQGVFCGATAEAIDITEKRRAESNLNLASKLEVFARRRSLPAQLFNVDAELESMAPMIRQLISLAGGQVQINPDLRKPRFVTAVLEEFERALVGLVVRSRDSIEGHGDVSIGVRSVCAIPTFIGGTSGSGRFVAISVAVIGADVVADKQEEIFE